MEGGGGGGATRAGGAGGLELAQDLLRPGDDGTGQAGEAGDVDAVGVVGGAGDDVVEEDDFLALLGDGDVVVDDGG